MEENASFLKAIYETKTSIYDENQRYNFKLSDELMVTITLAEYRDLVSKAAIAIDREECRWTHIAKVESQRDLAKNAVRDLLDKIKNEGLELTREEKDKLWLLS